MSPDRSPQRPSRRALLGGGLAAAAVVSTRGLPALAASKGGAGTAAVDAVDTRAAPPVPGELGVVGETGLEPFGLIGVSAPGLSRWSGAELRVLPAGNPTWGPWIALTSSHAPDSSEPIWVGDADGYELRGLPEAASARVHLVRDRPPRPDRSPLELRNAFPRFNVGNDPTPPIIPREAWGARPPVTVGYEPTIRLGIVHHSVTSNTYGPNDVPAILRSIQAYHMDVNGWWDIAYQFLIDKFGNMWEGRGGGIDESFFGAHSLGFNANTFGVCNMGDFSQAQPTSAMVSSIAELMAWKLKRYDIDAAGLTTVQCTGDNEWYRDGQVVTFPAIVGHGDTRPDECPGHLLAAWLPWIRTEAHNRQYKYAVKPPPAAASEGPLCRNADGRLEVFAIGTDRAVHNIWQEPTWATGWSALNSLGGSFPPGALSAISNADGRLEIFLAGDDGLTYHSWQAPGSPNGWSGAYGLSSRTGSAPAVARNQDGRLEVFGIDTTGQLWHAWQVTPNSGWSDPQVLATGLTGSPGVGAGGGPGTATYGRLTVWAVTAGGDLAGTVQSSAGGSWGPAITLGAALTGRPAVGSNDDGRIEVFALGADHRLYHAWQNGFVMSPVTALGNGGFAQPPAVGRNLDGRLEVVAVGTDGHLWHTYQLAPNSAWSDLAVLDGHTYSGPPSVTSNADGRLEVFVAGAGGRPWHGWQVAPNSGWSTFIPLY